MLCVQLEICHAQNDLPYCTTVDHLTYTRGMGGPIGGEEEFRGRGRGGRVFRWAGGAAVCSLVCSLARKSVAFVFSFSFLSDGCCGGVRCCGGQAPRLPSSCYMNPQPSSGLPRRPRRRLKPSQRRALPSRGGCGGDGFNLLHIVPSLVVVVVVG